MQPRQPDHWKLQPLGFVNGHEAHGVQRTRPLGYLSKRLLLPKDFKPPHVAQQATLRVLALPAPSREASVVLFDNGTNTAHEAVVSLAAGRVAYEA